MTRNTLRRFIAAILNPRTAVRRRKIGFQRASFCERLEDRALLSTFQVTNSNNSGTGSLRTAIERANANSDADVITFNIAGNGPHRISLTSGLPSIQHPVEIDGWSQPGFSGRPLIELNGASAGNSTGLYVRADQTAIRGLVIRSFSGYGIVLDGADDAVIQGNYIGTTADGLSPAANGRSAILAFNSSANALIGVSNGTNTPDRERNVLSGNTEHGVYLYGSTDNVIAGNMIGVGADGMTRVGNGGKGIQLQDNNGAQSLRNVIGGDFTSERNVISGNGESGVLIFQSSDNTVSGNYIGLGSDGRTAVGNGEFGISIYSDSATKAAAGNYIGGDDHYKRNVISGNTKEGVLLTGTSRNTVAGNYIGITADGTEARGNRSGIWLQEADSNGFEARANTIGGVSDSLRNVISGNVNHGIVVQGANAKQNSIQMNHIGTTTDGRAALGNGLVGLVIESGQENRIEDNTISGNGDEGIALTSGASYNVLQGNMVGTNRFGNEDVPNQGIGLVIFEGSSHNIVGGAQASDRNTISGNVGSGVYIGDTGSSYNRLVGNRIGTATTGNNTLPNHIGIYIANGATDNIIGGTLTGEGNLISGNSYDGILVRDAETINNIIQGNFIGTSESGLAALGNGSDGVEFDGAGVNILGGTAVGAGNVISGNTSDGVEIWRAAQGQIIQGNLIGVGSDGTTPLGNMRDGITISGGALQGNPPAVLYVIDVSTSTNDPFKGTPVGDVNGDGRSNTILDAELAGFIEFTEKLNSLGFGSAVSIGVTVFAGNGDPLDMDSATSGEQLTTLVGADTNNNGVIDIIDVLRPIRPQWMGAGSGTSFPRALDSTVTTFQTLGTRSGDGNIIFVSDGENSGGNNFGSQLASLDSLGVKRIAIGMGTDSRLTQLQLIDPDATQVTSTDEFSNTLLSVLGLSPDQSGQQTVVGTNVTVGGTTSGAGNVIAHNGRDGVDATNFLAIGNSILGNSIYDNGRLGINLGHSGVTPNDSNDADAGANQLTNFPVLTSATLESGQHRISGSIQGLANQTYRVELFANETADSSGHGEGRFYLGSLNATTNSSGNASFSSLFSVPTNALWITATATDSESNTSEFAAAIKASTASSTVSTFTVQDVIISENAGTLNFVVSVDNAVDIPITVTMSFTDGSATGGADYQSSPINVVFPANSTSSRTFSVPIIDDSIVETAETLIARLSTTTNLSGRTVNLSDTATGTINDNDVAVDFTVTETTGVTSVTESGTSDTFSVVLTQRPVGNVVFNISSSDTGEATVNAINLTFTETNWNMPQVVTVSGVNDGFVDGDQTATITISVNDAMSDNRFDLLPDKSIAVSVKDSQAPDADNYADAVIRYAPLHTGGPGPTNSKYKVPTKAIGPHDFDNAVDPDEGFVTLGRGGLLEVAFLDNVLVNSGTKDLDLQIFEIGADVETTIVSVRPTTETAALLPASADPDGDGFFLVGSITGGTTAIDIDAAFPGYQAGTLKFDAVQIIDDRNQGATTGASVGADIDAVLALMSVSVSADFVVTESNNSTSVSETGTRDNFTIVLNQSPASNVVLGIQSADPGEAIVDRSQITFTSATWNIPQTVTVTGVDDNLIDGAQTTAITISVIDASSADEFNPLPDKIVKVLTADDDSVPKPLQTIRSTSNTMIVAPGTFINVPVAYQTFDANGNASALKANLLSFNLHFDADSLTFVETAANIFSEGLQVVPNVARLETDPTVTGDDGDSATETVLVAAYTDSDSALSLGWPNQHSNLPQTLYTARFKVNSNFTGSVINFSANATGTAIGQSIDFGFGSTPLTLIVPQTLPTITIADATAVSEGGSAQFVVQLSKTLDSEVSVQYSLRQFSGANPASIGADLPNLANQVLVFLPGETQKTITVATTNDATMESTEAFEVVLANPVGGTIGRGVAVGSILDNDSVRGDVDGDTDFDANDAFMMHLVNLSGSENQIEQSKGSSPLSATQIRLNVQALGTAADVDGDGDFDANDSFLVQLVKLAGSDNQINQSKGSSALTAAQIRDRVSVLAGGSGSPANKFSMMARQSIEVFTPDLRSSSSLEMYLPQPDPVPDEELADAAFREWIDVI